MCDDQGVCSNSGKFAGNAPAGSYHYTVGWYLGTDTKGNPVSYTNGTGPGFGGKYLSASAEPIQSTQPLSEVICMPTASFNCSVDGKEIEDEDLPKYLPIVKEQDVKKAGGGQLPECPAVLRQRHDASGLKQEVLLKTRSKNTHRCATHTFAWPITRTYALALYQSLKQKHIIRLAPIVNIGAETRPCYTP